MKLEDEYERLVTDSYLRSLDHGGPVELLDLQLASGTPHEAMVRVARLELPCTDGTTLVFTATLSRPIAGHAHQFLGIYDDAGREASEAVASACHFSAHVATLDHGHTVPLGGRSGLRDRGYVGLLILGAGIYAPFRNPCPPLAGVPTSLYAVVPLEERELDLKRSDGLGRVLDLWQAERRDILHLRRRGPTR